jgi:CubicO group peptidase (beta-lactamase class C family)
MMTLGLILILVGMLALVAGLLGLVLVRRGGRRDRRLRATLLATVGALLMLSGLALGGAGRTADLFGVILLTVTSAAIVVALGLPAVARAQGRGSTSWAIISGVVVALLVTGVAWAAIETRDLKSLLILTGLFFVVLGAVAFVLGLLWLVVQLIRRKGRAAAAQFVWSTVSVVVFGLVGVAILAPQPPSVPDSMGSPAELDQYLKDLANSGGPPGISLVVVKDGETVYDKAFGLADGPNAIPATPSTVYHWFSVTKIPTAIAVMQLVDQGLVDLDDEVAEYLPFFEVDNLSATSRPVTIAQLLNHSSGLPDDMPACMGCIHLEDEPALNQTDLLRDEKLPGHSALLFEPGSKAVYTNVGYHALGVVVEQVSGQSYEDYVVDNILEPLGMTSTRFDYTEAMKAGAAVGAHSMAGFQTVFFPLVSSPWPSEYIRGYDDGRAWFNRFLFDANPPSGLIGPADEMARLGSALLNGGELEGARILGPESVEVMFTDRHVTPGRSNQWGEYDRFDTWEQGLGWKVIRHDGRLHYAHGGGGAAFKALMRLYPDDDLVIVILVNSTNAALQDIADAIAEISW